MEKLESADDANHGPMYDLCVIGAGIAGLNALCVAQEYLPKTARVALIDQNPKCGGMWNSTYDYVRLHQPHGMFTAGNIGWNSKRPDHYLASGAEVLGHLEHCLDAIRRILNLTEFWNCRMEVIEEISGPRSAAAEVRFESARGAERLRAARVIDARSADVSASEVLRINSDQVLSTTPERLFEQLAMKPAAPVYIVGGGKTGMDTVIAIAEEDPDRKLVLLTGTGTVFMNRDTFFPTGLRRLWSRTTGLLAFKELVERFDGENEDEVFEYFRSAYAVSPEQRGERHMFGILSDAERVQVEEATSEIVYDYLTDIVDEQNGPEIILRSGRRRKIEPGAIVVNCTGYVYRKGRPKTELLSDNGTILSLSSRTTVNFLSSMASFMMSHLFFREKLASTPIHVLDVDAMMGGNSKMLQMAMTTQSLLNALICIDALPPGVFQRCGVDLDRWHPIHRRAWVLLNLYFNKRRLIAHCQKTLRIVAERSTRAN